MGGLFDHQTDAFIRRDNIQVQQTTSIPAIRLIRAKFPGEDWITPKPKPTAHPIQYLSATLAGSFPIDHLFSMCRRSVSRPGFTGRSTWVNRITDINPTLGRGIGRLSPPVLAVPGQFRYPNHTCFISQRLGRYGGGGSHLPRAGELLFRLQRLQHSAGLVHDAVNSVKLGAIKDLAERDRFRPQPHQQARTGLRDQLRASIRERPADHSVQDHRPDGHPQVLIALQ